MVGALTFVNFIWALAICIGAVCLVLFIVAISPELVQIPDIFWEMCVYGLAGGAAYGATTATSGVVGYIALTSAVLFGAAITLSTSLRECDENKLPALFFAHAAISTTLAVYFGSQLTAALAVSSFMAAAGFSTYIGPLSYAFGFREDEVLGKSTAAAALLLASFITANTFAADVGAMKLFEPGVLHICSFVLLLGLLIKASRFYSNGVRYLTSNVFFIGAALGMLALGSMFDMGEMQKYSGTFIVFYSLSKLADIPADSVIGYSFLGILGCGAASVGAWYVNMNVDFFAPYLFGL